MPYAINTTPVGSNEYSLIRTLHQSILEPFDPRDRPDIEPGLHEDGIQVLAHLEGNPVGFLVAVPRDGRVWLLGCGVMDLYRGRGVCSRMLDWLQTRAGAMGLETHVNLPSVYVDMARLLQKRNAGESTDPQEGADSHFPSIIIHSPPKS